jgi:N-acylneuraminate cytidylyltransferase
MDFDGVHTTNTALINFQGEEFVSVNRSDGLGLNILKENNFQMLILSKESNRVVSARAEKLGIPCIQGVEDKLPELIKWLNKVQITPHEVIYLGNDLNDMDCLRASGLSVVVADAYPQAKRVSTLVLRKNGGDGAIRELCDLVSLSRSFG